MSCHYRCSHCRTRNVFPRRLGEYKRLPRCRDCGSQRFYVDKERSNRRPCNCAGSYHWGPHRPGSPHCLANPNAFVNRAKRAGATPEELDDLRVELAWQGIGAMPVPVGVVPF